jgi:hypothetical protein
MTSLASWTIVNNEIDFLPDIIAHHLPFLNKMYFLDTGSTDGTLDFLREQNNPKIVVQEYHTKYTPQYEKKWEEMSNPFPEVEVRNFALEEVEKLDCEWLIQLDGDEVFLSSTREIIEQNSSYSILGHSTINPVEDLKKHPIERRHGNVLYDPHARIWKKGLGIRYKNNPTFQNKQYHCIPVLNDKHIYHSPKIKFVSDPIHFHLHWMYGKKIERFYSQLSPIEIARNQTSSVAWEERLPNIFFQRRKAWLIQDLQEKIISEPFFKSFFNQKQNSDTLPNLEEEILRTMKMLNSKNLISLPSDFYPKLKISTNDPSQIEVYFLWNEKLHSGMDGLVILLGMP